MNKIIAYSTAFFVIAIIAVYFLIPGDFATDYTNPLVDKAVWDYVGTTKINDSKSIVLYKNEACFNEFTLSTDKKKVENCNQRIFLKDKLMLVWDKTHTYKAGAADYANVISPPLYSLENNNGQFSMKNLIDTEKYVSSCDKQVWGMFTNGYDEENTRLFIKDDKQRQNIENQIVDIATQFKLGGVNIDFENMYSEDAGFFTTFIKELSEKLHAKNIILSVDVTKINTGSKFYSMCYNRVELSKYADYIILMSYDQFPRTSKVAGPVSALNWSEDSVKGMLSEVPTERLVLGIPLYTRVWEEQGGTVVSSPAVSMEESEGLKTKFGVKSTFDNDTSLDYFQYDDNGSTFKVWQENANSVQKRLELAKKYKMSGIACWCLGYESTDAKTILDKYKK